VADIPFELSDELAQRLRAVIDVEGKIPRALEALGPLASRRVGFLDVPAGRLLDTMCADTTEAASLLGADPLRFERTDGSLDTIVAMWSAFRGADAASLAEADRVLTPGGRLLVVHDYGRDDVSALADPDAPQYRSWSRREGPFLRSGGFRIRVLHCFWTFETIEDAQDFLALGFGDRGAVAAAALKRPRLSWNVAVYHRWRGGIDPAGGATDAVAPPA
jgi:SAM-dependent methyltransferase